MTGQDVLDQVVLSENGHAFIRVRYPYWANPDAYLRLSVLDTNGRRDLGPWGHLFDRRSQEAIGEPTPQQMLTLMPPFDERAFRKEYCIQWTGPLDPADD